MPKYRFVSLKDSSQEVIIDDELIVTEEDAMEEMLHRLGFSSPEEIEDEDEDDVYSWMEDDDDDDDDFEVDVEDDELAGRAQAARACDE